MVMGCAKCKKLCAVVFVLLGIAFLARDLGYWNFWNISWWTALFLWLGIASFGMTRCPECCAIAPGKKK
jgi:hypothetical protein